MSGNLNNPQPPHDESWGDPGGSAEEGKPWEEADAPTLVLRLYVTGMTPRSVRAITQITAICKETLPGAHQLEIIDIYQHPQLASENQIIASPTLLKVSPPPTVRLVGELSDRERVLKSLGVLERD